MLSNIGRTAIWRGVATGSQSSSRSVGHWSKLRRARVARLPQTNLQRSVIFLSRRYYTKDAEATAKTQSSTSRPKAKGPTTRNTKAAKLNAKGKAKRKYKAVPKKRKTLTKEQKVKLEARKNKEKIKSLKAAALLSPPKQLPSSAWLVLVTEFTKNGAMTSGVREASSKYKSLDVSEKEHYNNIAGQNKVANGVAFKKWVESHTPEQINTANKARASLKRTLGQKGSSKYSRIPDPRLPKAPVNARLIYVSERWKSEDVKSLPFGEANKAIHKEWIELSPAQKKPFEDAASADKGRYEQEYKTVFKHDLPARRSASATG